MSEHIFIITYHLKSDIFTNHFGPYPFKAIKNLA